MFKIYCLFNIHVFFFRYFLNYALLGWLYSKVNSNKQDIRIVALEQAGSYLCKYLKLTPNEGIENMYENLKIIINFLKINNMRTHIILETGAGQGTELLSTKENSLLVLKSNPSVVGLIFSYFISLTNRKKKLKILAYKCKN